MVKQSRQTQPTTKKNESGGLESSQVLNSPQVV